VTFAVPRPFDSSRSYLPEANALFAAMTVQPSSGRKVTINNTIRALKNSGVWDRSDLIYMLAAHDSQAARLNWKNPGTNTLSEVNSPTFTTDRGYTGDGVSMALESAYTNTLFAQDDGHLSCFCLTETASGSSDISVTNITPASRGFVRARTGVNALAAVSTAAGTTSALATAVPRLVAANRTNAANQSVYSNGAFDATSAQASSAVAAVKVTFLGNGVASFSTRQSAFGTVGASLSADQHAALYAASLAYLQAVGAV